MRVFDQYADKIEYSKMKEDQLIKFASYNGKCQNDPSVPCDLFLLSWTCTPPTDVWEDSKEPNRNLGSVMATLPDPNLYGQIVNLVYVDYAEYARVTDVAAVMNP